MQGAIVQVGYVQSEDKRGKTIQQYNDDQKPRSNSGANFRGRGQLPYNSILQPAPSRGPLRPMATHRNSPMGPPLISRDIYVQSTILTPTSILPRYGERNFHCLIIITS
mgnify:CR=1 FL=1